MRHYINLVSNLCETVSPNYVYHTNCIKGDGQSIIDMVDRSHEISYEEFISKVGYDEFSKFDPQWPLYKNDFTFHQSIYQGTPCVYFVHSRIEYVYLGMTNNVENNDIYYYHITLADNVRVIKGEGLIPSIGERSAKLKEPRPAVYLFTSKEASEDALMGWLNDEFYEDQNLAILKIDKDAPVDFVQGSVGYEILSYETIPPEYVYVDSYI